MSQSDRVQVLQLLADVTSRTGIHFCDRHIDRLQNTIDNAVSEAGCPNIAAFRRLLRSDNCAFDDFVGRLTVGETFFFRDVRQFELIRDEILPEIRQRTGGDSPRLWSAGCATGEEAYSLAILLEEASPRGAGRVLATDISRRSLERARQARYREWSLRGEQNASVRRYLNKVDELYVLEQRIKDRVQFLYLNLGEDVYPSESTGTQDIDLILCRNVLIYFNREMVARVCRRLLQCLVPGGWLVLGASDPNAAAFADFDVVSTNSGLVFRRPSAASGSGFGRYRVPNSAVTEGRDTEDTVEEWNSRAPDIKPVLPVDPDRSVHVPPRTVEAWPAGSSGVPLAADDGESGGEQTADAPELEAECLSHVRALANRDVDEAEKVCGEFVVRHRLSEELHYLHAMLLISLGRNEESLEQLRRLIFLNRSLVVAHFAQGIVLSRLGRLSDANRSFRNVVQLCDSRQPGEVLPLGEGETAHEVKQAARRQLEMIAGGSGDDGR